MSLFKDIANTMKPRVDDDDDFFEDADDRFRPAPPAAATASAAQLQFESAFGQEPSANPEPERRSARPAGDGGSIFGNLGGRKTSKPRQQRERVVNFGGRDTQVVLFNPRTFDEALELVNYLQQGRSVVMTLEGAVGENMDRRLLDFLSGVAFAMHGKITPISGKGYFVSPQNVDLLNAQDEQPLNDGQYF